MGSTVVSAVINCYNEEIWIEHSIRSLMGIVDEIVVYDNVSTDKTAEITKSLIEENNTTSEIKYVNPGSPQQLADARNAGMSLAKGDWILKWDGDFLAYRNPEPHQFVRGLERLISDIKSHKYDDFDIVLLHSLNVSGDVFHFDKRRKYLGLSGDSFITKRGRVNYQSDDRYPDTGIIRAIDGGPAKICYLNKPGDEIYFLHMFGVKDDSYHLYRSFMVDYQIAISNGFNGSFEIWYEENRSVDWERAEKYIHNQMMSNLRPHGLPIPSIIEGNSSLVEMFSVRYEGGTPASRASINHGDSNVSCKEVGPSILQKIELWFNDINPIINTLSVSEINRELTNKEFLNHVLRWLCNNEIKFEINDLQSMVLCLSICTVIENPPLEVFYLEKIRSKSKNIDCRVRGWVDKRIGNLMETPREEVRADSQVPRVCLLVSGQLRSFEHSMRSWKQYFEGVSVDCFVSTWDTIGYKQWSDFNFPGDLVRVVDSTTYEVIIKNYSNDILEQIRVEYEKNHVEMKSSEMRSSLQKILNWTENLDIKIVDESNEEFSDFTNDQKMYFHNSNASEQVLDPSKYDAIIKLRPDIILHDNNNRFIHELPKIWNGSVLAEKGYTISTWGFGIGDQMVAVPSKSFRKIFSDIEISNLVHDLCKYIGRPKYSFHTTIGLSAWLEGLKYSSFNKYTRMGIFQEKLVSLAVEK